MKLCVSHQARSNLLFRLTPRKERKWGLIGGRLCPLTNGGEWPVTWRAEKIFSVLSRSLERLSLRTIAARF